MRRTELLVNVRKRRRCPEHLSPFATCHLRSWQGSGNPARLRSWCDQEEWQAQSTLTPDDLFTDVLPLLGTQSQQFSLAMTT
jgi:hypothetical protein